MIYSDLPDPRLDRFAITASSPSQSCGPYGRFKPLARRSLLLDSRLRAPLPPKRCGRFGWRARPPRAWRAFAPASRAPIRDPIGSEVVADVAAAEFFARWDSEGRNAQIAVIRGARRRTIPASPLAFSSPCVASADHALHTATPVVLRVADREQAISAVLKRAALVVYPREEVASLTAAHYVDQRFEFAFYARRVGNFTIPPAEVTLLDHEGAPTGESNGAPL